MRHLLPVAAVWLAGCGKPVWGMCPVPDQGARDGVEAASLPDDTGGPGACSASFDEGWLVLLDRALVDQAWERHGVAGPLVVELGPLLEIEDVSDEVVWASCSDALLDQLPLSEASEPVDGLWGPELMQEVVVGRYPSWALRSGAPSPGMAGASGIPAEVVAEMFEVGASLWVQGTITCDDGAVAFGWALRGPGSWMCHVEHSDVAWGGERFVGLRLGLSRLFQLDPEEQGIVSLAPFVEADADADGVISREELEQASLVGQGWQLEPFGAAANLQELLDERSEGLFSTDGGACSPAPLRVKPPLR